MKESLFLICGSGFLALQSNKILKQASCKCFFHNKKAPVHKFHHTHHRSF